jgi:pantothenate kinase
MKDQLYPYLLVNLRSGASFYRVDGEKNFKRVGGSSLGVSFVWGVTRYLGAYSDPTLMCKDAIHGDSSKVDMSVDDIYGCDYEGIGLPGRFLASSFGKLKDLSSEEINSQITGGDISRSLITMVVANVLVFSKSIAQ